MTGINDRTTKALLKILRSSTKEDDFHACRSACTLYLCGSDNVKSQFERTPESHQRDQSPNSIPFQKLIGKIPWHCWVKTLVSSFLSSCDTVWTTFWAVITVPVNHHNHIQRISSVVPHTIAVFYSLTGLVSSRVRCNTEMAHFDLVLVRLKVLHPAWIPFTTLVGRPIGAPISS